MKKRWLLLFVLIVGIGALAIWGLTPVRKGLSARETPTAAEIYAARKLRHWTTPVAARSLRNPVPADAEMLRHGMEHWADHCAVCHANDGSGKTIIGTNLYPKAPDMRNKETQALTDGELYYIIRNGVRMTGMPAWGKPEDGAHDHETWMLVLFIRHLPNLTTEELQAMAKLNPKSPSELAEEKEEEQFLSGEDSSTVKPNR